MPIEAIPIGDNPPDDVNVIIEVPVGGDPIKYEMDKAAGTMFVDRFLYTSMQYPGNYGFVPHTLSDDGDSVDVLVPNQRPLIPGAVINCRPIGVLLMEDEAGAEKNHRRAEPPANQALRAASFIREPACHHPAADRALLLPITRIWKTTSGSRSSAGAAGRSPRYHPRIHRTRPGRGRGVACLGPKSASSGKFRPSASARSSSNCLSASPQPEPHRSSDRASSMPQKSRTPTASWVWNASS